jgi:predicted nicotinamide N-methyase
LAKTEEGEIRTLGSEQAGQLAALQQFMTNGAGVEVAQVQLPVTGRTYRITMPTEAARGGLFAEVQDQPDAPKPFWAQLWPSGIALADALSPAADEFVGMRVLELGSGLGVTATAAIEAGARLTAVDYTELALAFCRHNTLTNAGLAPRTLALNWRAPEPRQLAQLTAEGLYPIILAADVLYFGRDIEPLMRLIDQVLAPDGVLWLAEPGRATAARFLLALAERGWIGTSSYSDGPWPTETETRVYVHRLQRPTELDWLRSSLGGWRT